MKQEYNGYTIELIGSCYKIFEKLSTGKFKVRRHGIGTLIKGKRDQWGNQLFEPYTSPEHTLQTAKNFIDNYIVPWEQKKLLL